MRTKKNDEMLTPREAKWVAEYVATSSVKNASEAAGYSSSTNLLSRPRVANAVGKRMEKIMARKEITAERVVEELGKLAFANIDDFVDENYAVMEKPKRRKMAAVKSVKTTTTKRDGDDEGKIEKVELQLYDKLGALNALGRHFGLFKDRIELSGDLAERLDRASKRLNDTVVNNLDDVEIGDDE